MHIIVYITLDGQWPNLIGVFYTTAHWFVDRIDKQCNSGQYAMSSYINDSHAEIKTTHLTLIFVHIFNKIN